MPSSTNPDWIDWRNSQSRKIIISDLEAGVVPMELSAEEAWAIYATDEMFIREFVVFSQFEQRFYDHKRQVIGRQKATSHEEAALQHDLALHPPSKVDSFGRPFWHMSDAKKLLAQDMKDKMHERFTPGVLRNLREEYRQFDLTVFRQHIYQEIRRQKFAFYCEQKRIEKEEKEAKKRNAFLRKHKKKRKTDHVDLRNTKPKPA